MVGTFGTCSATNSAAIMTATAAAACAVVEITMGSVE
jgi:hypothetical protein